MNNEFKKTIGKNQTVYTLESTTAGSSSTGANATISKPVGGVHSRGQIVTSGAEKKVPASTPRNFVAKNAKTGGAGAHRDKKRDMKQGVVKHKKPFMEDHSDVTGGYGQGSYDTYAGSNHGRGVAEEDDTEQEIGMAGSELYGIAKHAKELLALVRQHGQSQGLEAWQQSKITKAADYLNAVLQSLDYDTNGKDQGVAEGLSKRDQKDVAAIRAAIERLQAQLKQPNADKAAIQQSIAHERKRLALYKQGVAEEGSENKYSNLSKRGVDRGINRAGDDFNRMLDLDQAESPHYKTQHQQDTKQRLKTKPMAGPKGVLPEQGVAEEWSQKYKSSINCSHPKGFSQKAHCAGKKKHEESMMTMEATCPDCGMCQTHGNVMEIKKGAKDSNGFTKCWPGKHAVGTKKGKNGGQVRDCRPNEGVAEGEYNPDTFVGKKGTYKGYGITQEGPSQWGISSSAKKFTTLAAAKRHIDKVLVVSEQGVAEARTSAAQRLSTAWDRQRAKSDASLARTPGSIPKKPEPKKADPVPKTVSEHRVKRRALMAQMLNSH